MPQVPPVIFNVPDPPFVNVPEPPRAVEIVTVPLFVTVPGKDTVSVDTAMGLEPLKDDPEVEIVVVPVNVTVPLLFEIPAPRTRVALAPLIVPPFNVIRPVKVLLLVLAGTESVPVVIVVVPVTVKAVAAVLVVVKFPPPKVRFPVIVIAEPCVKVPPLIYTLPPTVRTAVFDTVAVPLKVKLFVTEVTANVLAPLPLRIRLLYATTFTV